MGNNNQNLDLSGAGGPGNSIYTADDTIGSGRKLTITDNVTFVGSSSNNVLNIANNGEMQFSAGGNMYGKMFTNGDWALGGNTIIGVQAGITLHRNTLVKGEGTGSADNLFQVLNSTNNAQFKIFGNGSIILGGTSFKGSEKISIQGRTGVFGADTLSTSTAFEIYDGDTTPLKWLDARNNGKLILTKPSGATTDYVLTVDNSGSGTGTGGIEIKQGASDFGLVIEGDVNRVLRTSKSGGVNIASFGDTEGSYLVNILNHGTAFGGGEFANFVAGSSGASYGQVVLGYGTDYGLISGGDKEIRWRMSSGNYHAFKANSDIVFGGTTAIGSENFSLQGNTLIDGTLDLNDHRIEKAVYAPSTQETTSTATLTVTSDTKGMAILTAMAVNTTIASPTGTPVQGQKLTIRLKDDGTSRTLTWNSIFRAIGVTLPTATTASKTLYVGCIYNSTDTKWDVVAVNEEA